MCLVHVHLRACHGVEVRGQYLMASSTALCMNDFPIGVIKYHDQSSLREKEFVLTK